MGTTNTLHPAAASGFAQQADAYARGRPDYPQAVLPWLGEQLGLQPAWQVLDLGAGTGKFSRYLLDSGAQVTALEPVAAMRAKLASLPGLRVLDGTAEAIPLPDASLDAVFAATAFHWFATPAALAEIARVLRPGGWLVLLFNVRDESVDWVAAMSAIMQPYEGDTPRYRKGDWRKVFPAPGFSALQQVDFPYLHRGAPEQVIVDRVLSVSFIAALPDPERAKVHAALTELIATHPALAGQAEIALPYRTELYCCQRR
jgi:SAM-dependent methyltransferase